MLVRAQYRVPTNAVPAVASTVGRAGRPAQGRRPRGGAPVSGSGLSASRLATMREVLTRHVARGDVPGLVALVARRGRVPGRAIGPPGSGGGEPMRRDAIFRIASVSKLITAAAAMILMEECRLRLDDPVDDLLPELADRKVLTRVDAPLDDTVPARR